MFAFAPGVHVGAYLPTNLFIFSSLFQTRKDVICTDRLAQIR